MTRRGSSTSLWGFVNATATGAISVPLGAMIANRWFVERRGLVTGLLTASNATGQLIFLPASRWIVGAWGWRYAAGDGGRRRADRRAAARAARHPRPAARPRSARRTAARSCEPPPPSVGNPLLGGAPGPLRGRRLAAFWLLAGSFFICGASTNGLIGDAPDPGRDGPRLRRGRPPRRCSRRSASSTSSGTICSGWLTDRYDPRLLLAWYYGLRGLSLLALPYAFGSPHFGLILFVIFYGLDWVATVPPTVALTSEIFGARAASESSSAGSSPRTCRRLGGRVGRRRRPNGFGGYGWAFGTSGLLCLFAVGLVTQINRRPQPVPALAV